LELGLSGVSSRIGEKVERISRLRFEEEAEEHYLAVLGPGNLIKVVR